MDGNLSCDYKGKPIEDLRKAQWYLQKEIDRRELEADRVSASASPASTCNVERDGGESDMRMSLDTLYEMIAPEECWTVHDRAGLEALPVGAEIYDAEGDLWDRDEDGFGSDAVFGTLSAAEMGDSAHWFPFVIANPEILGRFDPEYDVPEPIKLDTDNPHKGRRVTVRDRTDIHGHWDGLQAEVLLTSTPNALLRPLANRPDGFERQEFYWPLNLLDFHEELEEQATLSEFHADGRQYLVAQGAVERFRAAGLGSLGRLALAEVVLEAGRVIKNRRGRAAA